MEQTQYYLILIIPLFIVALAHIIYNFRYSDSIWFSIKNKYQLVIIIFLIAGILLISFLGFNIISSSNNSSTNPETNIILKEGMILGFFGVKPISTPTALSTLSPASPEILPLKDSIREARMSFTKKSDSRSIQFLDDSIGYPELWFWNFGDGTTSQEKNPIHDYMHDGKYMVYLKVVYPGGDWEQINQSITISGPVISKPPSPTRAVTYVVTPFKLHSGRYDPKTGRIDV